MENQGKNLLLRIFIDSTDKFKYRPLYEMIVYRAKKQGLAGATVLQAVHGFGKGSIIHQHKLFELADKEPVAVEIIDEEKKIRAFLDEISDFFEKMPYGCLVTLEKVDVMLFKTAKK